MCSILGILMHSAEAIAKSKARTLLNDLLVGSVLPDSSPVTGTGSDARTAVRRWVLPSHDNMP